MPASNESARLAALASTGLMFTASEERFDRITRLACHIFGSPIAMVTLISENVVWFKSSIGLDEDRAARDIAFCGTAIEQEGILIIEDTHLDRRFSSNPLVTEGQKIRFYAGHPIHTEDGSAVGTVCILDTSPRTLNMGQLRCLSDLAAMAEAELGVQKALASKTQALEASHRELSIALAKLRHAFETAGAQDALATLGTMSAAFTHEISTPLGNSLLVAGQIERASAELMSHSASGSVKRSDLTRISNTMVEGSSILLDNLSSASEITRSFKLVSSDQVGMPWRRFNLLEVAHGALRALSPTLRQAHLAVDSSGIDPHIHIDGPPGPIEQIIANMANNAILHAYEPGIGGALDITASLIDGSGMFQLSFRDYGRGIRPEALSKLFEPFYSTRTQAGGTGLGLHIVREISTSTYQGSASASNHPDGGALFILVLSLAPSKLAAQTDSGSNRA
jgi:signal transduction histidine kinase